MWTKISSKQERDALTQDYLARRNRLRQRFVDEKLGDADLFYDAAKLFKPITTATAEATAEAQATTSKELQKVTRALEDLPRQITEEANFNPLTALFGTPALPAPESPQRLLFNPNQDLNIEVIERYGFVRPSELNLADKQKIEALIEQINKYNKSVLGAERKKAKKSGDKDRDTQLDRDIKALAAYRERIRLLAKGYKLTKEGKGFVPITPLKLKDNKFGDLLVDPVAVSAGVLRAFQGGNLAFGAPAY